MILPCFSNDPTENNINEPVHEKTNILGSDQLDTNQPVQSQKIARSLNEFRMKEEEGLFYP